MARIALWHVILASVLGMILLGSTVKGVSARIACSGGDKTYSVAGGDTLRAIAGRYQTTWQSLAAYNHLTNPHALYIGQHLCIPTHAAANVTFRPASAQSAAAGRGNPFPYGGCTWWADQRYYQLHGFYVPWTNNANAWQWTTRAYQYGWRVSSSPSMGSIINLQPGVEGAYGMGHVGVVERVLANGHVIASNMNWFGTSRIVNIEFMPGPGVTFISV
jgi:surface antigen